MYELQIRLPSMLPSYIEIKQVRHSEISHYWSLAYEQRHSQIRHSRKTQSQLPPRRTASQTSKIGQGQVSRRTPGLPQLEPNDLLSTTSTFPLQSSSYDFPCEMSQFTEPPVVGRQSFGLEMPTAITDYMLQLGVAPAISEHPVPSANIPFASYSFIAFPRLDQMPFEDVSFLELKGCFRLPERPYLDVFITKYFLFVHPCLPVLDEAEFWRIYNLKNHQNEFSKKISMFVLQAMLFASCVVGTSITHFTVPELRKLILYSLSPSKHSMPWD